MDLNLITMDRKAAREAFRSYRAAVRQRHSDEDEQLMRGYRALAQGKQLIDIRETIAAGGWFDSGLPRLAIGTSTDKAVFVERDSRTGGVTFLPETANGYMSPLRRKGVTRLGAKCALVHRDMRCPVENYTYKVSGKIYNATRYTCGHEDFWEGRHKAMIPPVPAPLRPARGLGNYMTLFEVENWTKDIMKSPKDPALLRHVGGHIYAVVAIWDLTELEQRVLSGMRNGNLP